MSLRNLMTTSGKIGLGVMLIGGLYSARNLHSCSSEEQRIEKVIERTAPQEFKELRGNGKYLWVILKDDRCGPCGAAEEAESDVINLLEGKNVDILTIEDMFKKGNDPFTEQYLKKYAGYNCLPAYMIYSPSGDLVKNWSRYSPNAHLQHLLDTLNKNIPGLNLKK